MKHLIQLAAVVMWLGAFICSADAAIVLSNGTVQLYDPTPAPGKGPPLEHIQQFGLTGGRVYTNQIDGSPFAVGSTVRTIGIIEISTALNGTNTPAWLPDTSSLYVIFAVEGEILTGGDIATAAFSKGRAYLVSDTTGNSSTFNIDDPATWNFANAFAEYALLSPQDVVPGELYGLTPADPTHNASAGWGFSADETNKSGVNTNASNSQVQGIFLFGEDSTADQNAGVGFVDPGLGANSGDNFIRDVVEAPFYPYPKGLESIVVDSNQTSRATFIDPTSSSAKMDALNHIFDTAFGVGFSGAGFEYTPTAFGGGTGDFVADLGGRIAIGYQAVPEPASMLVWSGLSIVGLGLAAARKRRLAAKTA